MCDKVDIGGGSIGNIYAVFLLKVLVEVVFGVGEIQFGARTMSAHAKSQVVEVVV